MISNNWFQFGFFPSYFFGLSVTVLLLCAVFVWYRRFLGVGARSALLILLLTVFLGIAANFPGVGMVPSFVSSRFPVVSDMWNGSWFWTGEGAWFWPVVLSSVMFRWLFLVFAISFGAKLYLKWVRWEVTDDEKETGAKGVRAWLSGGNLVCAVMMAFCGAMGFGYSFLSLLVMGVFALLLYPLITLASQPVPAPPHVEDFLTGDRNRILKMLDEGKINAEECADLLNALGATIPKQTERTGSMSASRKLILIGAALVMIGFSLPWFSVYRGQPIPWFLEMIGAKTFATIESNGIQGQIVSIGIGSSGLSYGLGWLVLLLSLGSALVPWFGREMSFEFQRRCTLWAAIGGGLILIVLVFPNLQSASIGVLLAFAGIVLEVVGALREANT